MEQGGFHGSLSFSVGCAGDRRREVGNGQNATERWTIDSLTVGSTVAESKRQKSKLAVPLQDAASRASEVLFRIANSTDLTGLSLEVDLAGVKLVHAGQAREQGEEKKAS
jgi:hypothetical protein